MSRKDSFKKLVVKPLHVDVSEIKLAVQNLTVTQNFSPNYAEQKAYGRMDPIVTYANTERSLQINFSCQAHHYFDGPAGVSDNIAQINRLTQMLYPSYYRDPLFGSDAAIAILNAPPFFRILYGNYIGSYSEDGTGKGENGDAGLTGYINSFTHNLESIPKNVAMGETSKKGVYRALPREIKVSMGFKVIHDHMVGWYDNQFSPEGYGGNFPYNVGKWVNGSRQRPEDRDKGSSSPVPMPLKKQRAAKANSYLKGRKK